MIWFWVGGGLLVIAWLVWAIIDLIDASKR
jgi:hypothetical protein